MLRAGLLKAQEAVEAIVEKVAPKEDEAPLVVEEPVVKKEEPKAKKAAKKKAN